MSTLKSITVTVSEGKADHTFEVDIAKNCVLVWGEGGWSLLADHYKHVKQDAKKERDVRGKTCPKATPKPGAPTAKLVAPAIGGNAVIALKDPKCHSTQWP